MSTTPALLIDTEPASPVAAPVPSLSPSADLRRGLQFVAPMPGFYLRSRVAWVGTGAEWPGDDRPYMGCVIGILAYGAGVVPALVRDDRDGWKLRNTLAHRYAGLGFGPPYAIEDALWHYEQLFEDSHVPVDAILHDLEGRRWY